MTASPASDLRSTEAHAKDDWLDRLQRIDRVESKTISHVGGLLKSLGSRDQANQMAEVLLGLQMETMSILAGAVFFAVRHRELDIEQLEHEGIARMVVALLRLASADGVADSGAPFLDRQSKDQIGNVRRMLIALINDPRIAVLKLSERLVTLKLARNLPLPERHRIAKEVLEFYTPLASRLGIWQLKWQLEDIAFSYMHEQEYKRIAGFLESRRVERELQVQAVCADLSWRLGNRGIKADVYGRAKNIFGIWRKMREKNVSFEAVYDIEAVRVVVDTVPECYAVLGVVHTSWPHIGKEFDDYIANPKANGYCSIHTAVIGPRGRTLEVQIRTHKMHDAAELGVCAHWAYKDEDKEALEYGKVDWLREVLHWQEELHEQQYIDVSRRNDAPQRIYISTPKGHVVDMPSGSTPIDFAYRVHTEVGHRCIGARVDGEVAPLNRSLETGQIVEIVTGKHNAPMRKWLDLSLGFVRTSRARKGIQDWFRNELDESNVSAGKQWLVEEIQRLKISVDVDKLASANGFPDADEMYRSIALGEYLVRDLLPLHLDEQEVTELPLESEQERPTKSIECLEILALDRPKLLLDVTVALAARAINVVGATIDSPKPGEAAHLELRVEVQDLFEISEIISELRRIPDIQNVRRSDPQPPN